MLTVDALGTGSFPESERPMHGQGLCREEGVAGALRRGGGILYDFRPIHSDYSCASNQAPASVPAATAPFNHNHWHRAIAEWQASIVDI